MSKNGKNKPRVEKRERTLRCKLTKEEVAERASRAAHLIQVHDQLESEMKADAKRARARLDEIEAEIRRNSAEVRDMAADRTVACEDRYDFERNAVVCYRLDVKPEQKVDERPMTNVERQEQLFPDGPGLMDPRSDGPHPDDAPPKKRGRKPKAAQANA